jgi:hypothetical protein
LAPQIGKPAASLINGGGVLPAFQGVPGPATIEPLLGWKAHPRKTAR